MARDANERIALIRQVFEGAREAIKYKPDPEMTREELLEQAATDAIGVHGTMRTSLEYMATLTARETGIPRDEVMRAFRLKQAEQAAAQAGTPSTSSDPANNGGMA